MLTISSIAVAPAPQTTPTVRAQPVSPVRPSQAVARDNAAGSVVAPQGEAARVQAQAAPPLLAPVTPPAEGQRADGMGNAAAPERSGLPVPAERNRPQVPTAAQRPADAPASDATAQAGGAQPQSAPQRAQARTADGAARSPQPGAVARQDEGFPPVKNPALEALDTQIKELLPNMWKASRAAVDMVIGEEALQAEQERAKRLEALQTQLTSPPLAGVPPGEPEQTYGQAREAGRRPASGGQIDQLA
ncbi:MAG: hypothetical protein AB1371_02870 [Pseudomonadota bacterium]